MYIQKDSDVCICLGASHLLGRAGWARVVGDEEILEKVELLRKLSHLHLKQLILLDQMLESFFGLLFALLGQLTRLSHRSVVDIAASIRVKISLLADRHGGNTC